MRCGRSKRATQWWSVVCLSDSVAGCRSCGPGRAEMPGRVRLLNLATSLLLWYALHSLGLDVDVK